MAAGIASAEQLTAFALARKGDRYIGEQSRDKVVGLHSERSVGGLEPEVWRVIYFDPAAHLKMTEVKFVDGRMEKVARPLEFWKDFGHQNIVFDTNQWRIDSDRALDIARSQPLLKGARLVASELTLEHGVEGPVWKVRFWAARRDNPQSQPDIGCVFVSAQDGNVVRADLHVDSSID